MALIERAELGGVRQTGCTPTKTMVASRRWRITRGKRRAGSAGEHVSVDMPAVVARKNRVVQNSRKSIQKHIDARPNTKLVRGSAKFIAPHQVQVSAKVFESQKIFINTGTRPAIPQIPGLDTVSFLSNETIMELQAVPEHLLVLGGGYIGLEFGQMFRRFGGRVTIIHNGERILPREDPDIASSLQPALEAEGIEFRIKTETKRIENRNGVIAIFWNLMEQRNTARFTFAGRYRTQAGHGRSGVGRSGRLDRRARVHQGERPDGDERPRGMGAGRCERRAGVHAHFLQRLSDCLREYSGREKSHHRKPYLPLRFSPTRHWDA